VGGGGGGSWCRRRVLCCWPGFTFAPDLEDQNISSEIPLFPPVFELGTRLGAGGGERLSDFGVC